MRQVLIDTGPLVAIVDEGDADHARCVASSKEIRADLVTTWPVVTEAAYLLASVPAGQDALLGMLEAGAVRVLELPQADVGPMRKLMTKYHDQPMDFADASLVRVAEREGIDEIFTLDRDFKVYRLARSRPFRIKP